MPTIAYRAHGSAENALRHARHVDEVRDYLYARFWGMVCCAVAAIHCSTAWVIYDPEAGLWANEDMRNDLL